MERVPLQHVHTQSRYTTSRRIACHGDKPHIHIPFTFPSDLEADEEDIYIWNYRLNTQLVDKLWLAPDLKPLLSLLEG